MKKMLSILSTIMLTSTLSSNVVSCSNNSYSMSYIEDLDKDEYKNKIDDLNKDNENILIDLLVPEDKIEDFDSTNYNNVEKYFSKNPKKANKYLGNLFEIFAITVANKDLDKLKEDDNAKNEYQSYLDQYINCWSTYFAYLHNDITIERKYTDFYNYIYNEYSTIFGFID